MKDIAFQLFKNFMHNSNMTSRYVSSMLMTQDMNPDLDMCLHIVRKPHYPFNLGHPLWDGGRKVEI